MNEEFIGSTKEQIRTLFENQKDIKKSIDRLEENQESLKEITSILKFQQQQYEDHHKAMELMSQNLIELNGTVKNLQADMDNVKKEVGDIRESGQIDLRQIFKQIIYTGLPTLIIGAVAYYLGKYGFHVK